MLILLTLKFIKYVSIYNRTPFAGLFLPAFSKKRSLASGFFKFGGKKHIAVIIAIIVVVMIIAAAVVVGYSRGFGLSNILSFSKIITPESPFQTMNAPESKKSIRKQAEHIE